MQKWLRRLTAASGKKHHVGAVIVAGGSGTRFASGAAQGAPTKQFTEIAGIPVVVRTMLAFDACADISEIVIAARADEVCLYDALVKQYGIQKFRVAVPGGETRRDSAMAGFEALSDRCDFVALHDAARCLVTPEQITRVIREAFAHGAAIAATAATDTLKRTGKDGFIEATVDRACHWHAQTPQVFDSDIYKTAIYTAEKNGIDATDDSALVERVGFRVKPVECGKQNMKLTTADDLVQMEALIRIREGSPHEL